MLLWTLLVTATQNLNYLRNKIFSDHCDEHDHDTFQRYGPFFTNRICQKFFIKDAQNINDEFCPYTLSLLILS